MKKKSLITISLLLLVSLSLTACTLKKGNGVQDGAGNGKTSQNEDEEESLNGDIYDLIKLGKNVKCTFEVTTEDGSTKGETYVSGKRSRSDITIETERGIEMQSTTVTDGEWLYMWSSESNQGTKMSMTDIETETEEAGLNQNEEETFNDQAQKFDYKCKKWIPDNSKFEIPGNIEFSDLTEMMKGFIEMGENLKNQN